MMRSLARRAAPTATNMIRADHTHVLATFHQYEANASAGTKKALVNLISVALEIHATLEEEIFYPAMRSVNADNAVVDKSYPEHAEMKRLIALLRTMQPADRGYDTAVMELMRDVLHHVADEETILLPDAERLMADRLEPLGVEMTKRRLELTKPKAAAIAWNTARALPTSTLLMSAGALLAGSMLARKTLFRRHTRRARHA